MITDTTHNCKAQFSGCSHLSATEKEEGDEGVSIGWCKHKPEPIIHRSQD